jgi:hypothetical protein
VLLISLSFLDVYDICSLSLSLSLSVCVCVCVCVCVYIYTLTSMGSIFKLWFKIRVLATRWQLGRAYFKNLIFYILKFGDLSVTTRLCVVRVEFVSTNGEAPYLSIFQK